MIYACADEEMVAFWENGTLAWSAEMNQTCQTEVAPVIDYQGRVGQTSISKCQFQNEYKTFSRKVHQLYRK